MVAALNGSGCKKKINRRLAAAVAASAMRHRRSWKEKNQPEVAAAVVAWRQCKMEVAARKNYQPGVAAAVVAWQQC